MPGFFIAFEGPDGSGTTRHSEWLAERLQSEGKEAVLTSEPTHGVYGEKVRQAVRGEVEMEPADIQKAFSDDRAEHVERVIQPALEEGKVVITDRYIPSTLIYGEAAGVSTISLKRWNERFPKPDIIFIMLPSFEVCLERIGEREESDEFEKEAFQRKVYEGYERYAVKHPEVKIIDTSGEKEDVKGEVWNAVVRSLHMKNRVYAFIDSQNLNLGVQDLGWKLDWKRFRVYLKHKYKVEKAFLFIGYIPNNQRLYSALQQAGFILIFKPVILNQNGEAKGNVDAELVLHAMIEYPNYDKAVIVSSDGDFACLVRYLCEQGKLFMVLSPWYRTCSKLLRKAAKKQIKFMHDLRKKLSYKNKKTEDRGGTKTASAGLRNVDS